MAGSRRVERVAVGAAVAADVVAVCRAALSFRLEWMV